MIRRAHASHRSQLACRSFHRHSQPKMRQVSYRSMASVFSTTKVAFPKHRETFWLVFRRQMSYNIRSTASSLGSPGVYRKILFSLLPVSAGVCGYQMWYYSQRQYDSESEDVELPPMPKPTEHFVHPYEEWPSYRRFWFTAKRSIFLAWVFAPFMWASTLIVIFPNSKTWRDFWLDQMLQCTQKAGAAFQKFGQWLSMRPDMFPPDVIEVLSKLRSDAPSHPVAVSRKTLADQLGHDVDELFEEFEDEPVASGSVGQVHRALLRPEFALDKPGGKLREVAVKVRHPDVADSAFMDLSIVWQVVALSEKFLHMTVPFNRAEFEEVIQAQMDFTREAFNLHLFSENFKGERRDIRFPKVASL